MYKPYWKLLRPLQWLKNGFVFTGIIFRNEYDDPHLLHRVIAVFIAFCMVSSCVYILNDIIDLDKDRQHPKKQHRPLAAGEISINQGMALAVALWILGIAIGIWVSTIVALILVSYIILNIGYSLYLKHIVLIDVFCISCGFMLRIIAGTLGVGIPPSKWLLLCGMMITLFIGFAKRRAELFEGGSKRREVLRNYSPIILEQILSICASSAIITYSLYTMSPETIHLHRTDNLIYTVPFVIYALFRYLFLVHHRNCGEDPSSELLKDPHILASVFGWALLTLYLVKVH